MRAAEAGNADVIKLLLTASPSDRDVVNSANKVGGTTLTAAGHHHSLLQRSPYRHFLPVPHHTARKNCPALRMFLRPRRHYPHAAALWGDTVEEGRGGTDRAGWSP